MHVQARSWCSGGNGESENKNSFCKLGIIPFVYSVSADLSLCKQFVCMWTQYFGIIFTESKHIFIICLAAEVIYFIDVMVSLAS